MGGHPKEMGRKWKKWRRNGKSTCDKVLNLSKYDVKSERIRKMRKIGTNGIFLKKNDVEWKNVSKMVERIKIQQMR